MEPYVHTLNREEHESFLKEMRHDPTTREVITDGDRIVICSKCKSVHLLSSWNSNGRKCPNIIYPKEKCECTNTLKYIPQENFNLQFEKRTNHTNPITLKENNDVLISFHKPRFIKRKIILLAIIIILSFSIGYALSVFFIAPYGITNGRVELIKIERGMGLSQVANILKKKGLINNSKDIVFIGRILGYEKKLKSGIYNIQPGSSHFKILKILVEGNTDYQSVTIPEGASTNQIIRIFNKSNLNFNKNEFLRLLKDRTFINSLNMHDFQTSSLEGFLFPETYYINNYADTRTILKILVDQFVKSWKENNCDVLYLSLFKNYFKSHSKLRKLTKYDVLILASIVDDLVNLDKAELMPDVARIYYNRLVNHERFYLKSQYKDINQYTRMNYGLPNKPLNNPGIQAIVSVLKPAKHGYINLIDIGIK